MVGLCQWCFGYVVPDQSPNHVAPAYEMMHAGATANTQSPRHRLEAPQSESLAVTTTDNNKFPDCLTLQCDLPNSNYL
jgi:hypothetical protein